MYPLFWIGAAGAALWWLAKGREPQRSLKELPPPPPMEGELGGGGGGYMEAWGVFPEGYEVFPPGASPASVPPPTIGSGVLASNADCTVVVATDSWWDAAGPYAQGLIDAGQAASVFEQLMSASPCAGVSTAATEALRAAVAARVSGLDQGLGLQSTPAVQVHMQTQPQPQIQIALGQGTAIRQHQKASGTVYTVVTDPKSVYHQGLGQHVWVTRWRAWKPGPVREGNYVLEGIASNADQAFSDAFVAIEQLPSSNPKRNWIGASTMPRLASAVAIGCSGRLRVRRRAGFLTKLGRRRR
jgi:hypothetical protein